MSRGDAWGSAGSGSGVAVAGSDVAVGGAVVVAVVGIVLNLIALWKQEAVRPMSREERTAPRPRFAHAWADYISGGRDGYLTFKHVVEDGRVVDTFLDYAQSFVDYVKKQGKIGKLPAANYSTKSFTR